MSWHKCRWGENDTDSNWCLILWYNDSINYYTSPIHWSSDPLIREAEDITTSWHISQFLWQRHDPYRYLFLWRILTELRRRKRWEGGNTTGRASAPSHSTYRFSRSAGNVVKTKEQTATKTYGIMIVHILKYSKKQHTFSHGVSLIAPSDRASWRRVRAWKFLSSVAMFIFATTELFPFSFSLFTSLLPLGRVQQVKSVRCPGTQRILKKCLKQSIQDKIKNWNKDDWLLAF